MVEKSDVPHVIRKCQACGREMHIIERGEHGKGIQIRPGDKFTFPPGWLKLSLNPLQSTGRLAPAGLELLAKSIFVGRLPSNEESFPQVMTELERNSDEVVNSFDPVNAQGLDINNEAHATQILEIMQSHDETRAYWAFAMGMFLATAREARKEGKIDRAMWSTACAERCRAMMLFKEHLQDVVWMGQSVKRITDILSIWDANKDNKDEEFWQITFTENSYVLSQIFAVPVVFIKDKAYVGGMKLDRTEGRFVDYLCSAESSREAILLEIKTPATPLLSSDYRGNRAPSHELSGSVVQAQSYRHELANNLQTITGSKLQLTAIRPKCALIIGNAKGQFKDDADWRSFQLFRTALNDVEIITYDELFRKVEILAELFNLKRAKHPK